MSLQRGPRPDMCRRGADDLLLTMEHGDAVLIKSGMAAFYARKFEEHYQFRSTKNGAPEGMRWAWLEKRP